MARIRTVKPELFQSYTIKRLSLEARWTFVGLLTHVDDDGYCRDEPRIIKGAVWPLEDDVIWSDVAKHIEELLHSGLLCRFHHNGVPHIHVVTFREHQKINRATKSRLPHCPEHANSDPSGHAEPKPETPPHAPLTEPSVSPPAQVTEGSSTERKGKEVELERDLERELRTAAVRETGDREASTAAADPNPRRGAPVWAVPLIDQLTAEGFVVSWDFGFVEWDIVRLAIDRSGVPAMVQLVHRRHQAAKSAAYSARAWLKGWDSLPTLDAGAALTPAVQESSNVIALPGQHAPRPSATARARAEVRDAFEQARQIAYGSPA